MNRRLTKALAAVAATGLLAAGASPVSARSWHQHYERRHYHDHHDSGGAVAAGALGFVLGAMIADSAQHRDYARAHLRDRAWLDHCTARYRSFDPRSGTYLGYDGRRHYCR